MIQIPCKAFSTINHPTVSVGPDEEEPCLLGMTVHTEPGYFADIGAHSRPVDLRDSLAAARGGEITVGAFELVLIQEIERMDAALADTQSTYVVLDPAEARAIAAMLNHYAAEAERR